MIIAVELFAALNWFGPYFRFGIPLYIRRTTAPVGAAEVRPRDLEPRFANHAQLPRVRFKALSQEWIAFREAFFESGNSVRYLPVMHSAVRLDPAQNRLTVVGYLNWYVIFTLIYIVTRSLVDPSFSFVGILVVILFGLSYFVQRSINHSVAEELKKMVSEPAAA